MQQFVSGNPGVSAIRNGSDHWPVAATHLAPRITTSSALRSPDPWNQQTSRSPFGHSTMQEPWLCQCSSGKISLASCSGAAVTAAAGKKMAIKTDQMSRRTSDSSVGYKINTDFRCGSATVLVQDHKRMGECQIDSLRCCQAVRQLNPSDVRT